MSVGLEIELDQLRVLAELGTGAEPWSEYFDDLLGPVIAFGDSVGYGITLGIVGNLNRRS